MKKPQAEIVAKLIMQLAKKHWLWTKIKDHNIHVTVQESENSKGWWGVYVSTDAGWYDYLYSNEGYYVDEVEAKEFGTKPGPTGGIQKEFENAINKKMKWKKGDHYFEPEGGGILYFF